MSTQRKLVTYSSKANKQRSFLSSSSIQPSSSDTLVATPPPIKRKRVDSDSEDYEPVKSLYDALLPSKKRRILKENTVPSKSSKKPTKKLTQLHLSLTSSIKTCKSCGLSYTTGAVDDEHLHRTHCSRVTRGLEWGKEEDKADGVTVLEQSVRLTSETRGRIVCFKADVKGKLKTKVRGKTKQGNPCTDSIPCSSLLYWTPSTSRSPLLKSRQRLYPNPKSTYSSYPLPPHPVARR